MGVKSQVTTVSVLCSAVVVVATVAPVVPPAHATPVRNAEYRYALTAAAFDAAFNPIQYLGNVGGAAQAVATDVIYWQTPDFPLLVLSAQVDPSTGKYEAVQKVTSTATHLQNLVGAVTAFPGASSSPQVQQLVGGIGAVGSAAASATQTVTATLAPHLAPLTPVIYVVRVAQAAVGVYYAVATLSTTGLGTVLSGQNPLTAVGNVVSSVQTLANVLAHAPRPASSSATATAATSTSAASQAATKTIAAAVTPALTGVKTSTAAPRKAADDGDQPQSGTQADVSSKHASNGPKSTEKHEDSPVSDRKSAVKRGADTGTAPKSTAAPTKPKASAADKATDATDAQAAPASAAATKAKRTAKSDDHTSRDGAAGHDGSTPKAKGDSGSHQH